MVRWRRGADEPGKGRKACELTDLGTELYGHGDRTAAAIAYRRAVRQAPGGMLPALHLMVGLLDSGVGSIRRARRMLRRAARADDPVVARRAQGALRRWAFDPDVMRSPRTELVEASDVDRLRHLVRDLRSTLPPEHPEQPGAAGRVAPRRARLVPRGAFQLAAFLLALTAIVLVETLLFRSGDAPRRLLDSWPVLVAAAAVAAGAVHYSRARSRAVQRLHLDRSAQPPAANELFVLYLRSFHHDPDRGAEGKIVTIPFARGADEHRTFDFLSSYGVEEQLLAPLRHLGRLVAVGTPGQVGPPAGPERLATSTQDWQDRVRELLRRARVVVLVLDPTPGTLWEFVEATRVVAPERLVLVVGAKGEYQAFRRKAGTASRERAEQVLAATGQRWTPPGLPAFVAPDSALPIRFFSGVVTYSPDWKPTFTPLDSVAPADSPASRMRRHLEPMLRRLAEYERALPDNEKSEPFVLEQLSYRSMPRAQQLPYLAAGGLVVAFLVLTRHIWAERPSDWLFPLAIGVLTSLRQVAEEARLRRRYGSPVGPRAPHIVRPDG